MAKNLKINIKNLQLANAFQVKDSPLKSQTAKADASDKEEAPKKRKTRLISDPHLAAQSEKLKSEEPIAEPEPIFLDEQEEELLAEAKVDASSTEETRKEEPVKDKDDPVSTAKSVLLQDRSSPKTELKKDLKSKKKESVRTFDARDRQGLRDIDNEAWRKKRSFKARRSHSLPQIDIVRPKSLLVRLPITVKDLAQEMKLKASQLISKLFMQGMTLTLNDYLDDETIVQLIGHEFACDITIDRSEQERIRITEHTIREEIQATSPESLVFRPPVVTFMGHVDHGKTSLIDAIRKSNRVASEAGAITQHIGAFKVHTPAGDVTILDTPGHEAFSEMRSRGANVTDIVILVVAGDEGMKAQTDEAIRQAKEANVPLVIAINKSDKENFDPQRIYRELSDRELVPEAWGGSTITVNCSASTREGISELLEMIALQAEILELKANPTARARGTVLESQMHKGLGAVATILIQNGTLSKGDAFVFGHCFGRVKTLQNDWGQALEQAGPSTPVKITGLSDLALAGSEFIVVKDEKEAKSLASARAAEGAHRESLSGAKLSSLEKMMAKKESSQLKILPLILRADVQGSLEAVTNSLLKIRSDKVRLEIVSADVGEISESDVDLAAASKATILGFHTSIESKAEGLIKQKKIAVYTQDVIYHLIDEVKQRMRSLLDKIEEPIDRGEAVVKAVFKSSQLGNIAGCQVLTGTILRSHLMRQLRNREVIWSGKIASLKREKEDVREVQKGMECGILLEGQSDFQEGDILQAYEITYLEQDL